MIKYSAIEHACYDTKLNYKNLPDDLVEISIEEHKYFTVGISEDGKQLKKHLYPFTFEDTPDKTSEDLANVAQQWAVAQLNNADHNLVLTRENSKRAKYTEESLIVYKEALRDYVRVVEGVLTISTEKPSEDLLQEV